MAKFGGSKSQSPRVSNAQGSPKRTTDILSRKSNVKG
jgi:hypothetical protein